MSGDNSKTWYAVDVVVEKAAAEAIEFGFDQLDALGTATDQLRRSNAETVTVTGYFNALPDDKILQNELKNALRIYDFDDSATHSITQSEIEDTDWLVEWKKHWQPTTVGRFMIAPPWSDVADTEKIVIRIEPNMAFGTGTHETTQLCLKAIDENYTPDMSLLDVGTGTGILAIAAAKLATEHKEKEQKNISVSSVAKIFACDTDEDSVKIARENADANRVDYKIEFSVGSITGETAEFDFVCANLTLDVITPLLPLLIGKSRQLLLLSGILVEQEDAVIADLLKLQISNFQIENAGEWISVLITDH
ncbi:MAG: 50S ribosomal protein L11 methyltransferase [Pyrinomonadaceae bacterium]